MQSINAEHSPTKLYTLYLLIIIVMSISFLPLPWNVALDEISIDLLCKLRGNRAVSDAFVLVYICDEEIRAIGSWPITHDYYGYLMHILSQLDARAVGFDLLLDSPDQRYPENDRLFAEFVELHGSVCLPVVIHDLGEPPHPYPSLPPHTPFGAEVTYPLHILRESAAALGFSNLENMTIHRRIPAVIATQDSLFLSFGIELARLYLGDSTACRISRNQLILEPPAGRHITIPLDRKGRMRLDHFGTAEKIQSYSLLTLFHLYSASPDSLDLKDKCVVVAATSTSIMRPVATPLARVLPPSLLHVTTAENIICENIVRELPALLNVAILFILIIATSLPFRDKNRTRAYTALAAILPLYLLLSVLLFSTFRIVLPVVYPLLFCIATITFWIVTRIRQLKAQLHEETRLHQGQITSKQTQLEEEREKLREVEGRLQKELDEKSILSQRSQEIALEKQQAIAKLEKQLRDLEVHRLPPKQVSREYGDIIYTAESPLAGVLDLIHKIGADTIPVLIVGETGTGKELIARAIHRSGSRAKSAFIAVNCGALTETLLESELFGHEKGSFTGAHSQRRGRFELADNGTLFLDEIAETSLAFQSKLLRVVQDGTFQRVGGEVDVHVDVRIIAATNRDIKSEVERGTFRSDLYYRLNGFTLYIPALRERMNDIPVLAQHFLKVFKIQPASAFSGEAIEAMQHYHWPGNVRELENVVRRAALLAKSEGRELIQVNNLPPEMTTGAHHAPAAIYFPLEEQILAMLRSHKFSRSAIVKTARALDDRDRGTITEYFRGICFETLTLCGYDIDAAARRIAESEDEQIIARVKAKMKAYVKNIKDATDDFDSSAEVLPPFYKGLPKKYHICLQQVIQNIALIK